MTYSQKLWDDVFRMRRDGLDTVKISEITGISFAQIRLKCKQEGINPRKIKIDKIQQLNVEQLAYIAGIIDGEGSIIIAKVDKTTKKYNNREKNIRYFLSLTITNTDKRLLEYIGNLLGNNTYRQNAKKDPKHRRAFNITITSGPAIELLNKVYPYLVIKKEQVDLANIFCDTFKESYEHKLGIPKHIQDIRKKCYDDMKILHKVEYD